MPIDLAVTLGTIKAIAGVAKDAGKIELFSQIIDLQQSILEAIAENTGLAQSNAELTREVNRLRSELDALRHGNEQRAAYRFRDDGYWRDGPEGEEGPFCPKCLDADEKPIRMTDRRNGFTCCVNCNCCIRTPGYVKPSNSQRGPSRNWVTDY